jgi:uncharacterized circularly permuted ATP-grasp superfamily protein
MSSTVSSDRSLTYDPGDFWDEAFDSAGSARPEYEPAFAIVEELGTSELARRVGKAAASIGATFGSGAGSQAFPIDPIPRLIQATEWAWLEIALAQRARALNAFIADVYAERRIVSAGIIALEAIATADHFEPAMTAVSVACGHAPVVGFDLVRGADGRLLVLEDNLRTPSGLAYASAVRRAVASGYGDVPPFARALDPCFGALSRHLATAAPGIEDPFVVLLSDGSDNTAWYEHRTLARRLGISLAVPEKLRLQNGRLCVLLPSGKLRPVDVVYRRTDEDRLRDEHGRPTWLAEMLFEPLQRGHLAVVNAPGSGVADDKLLHAYVEEMVRFYLGEEPLIESVRTHDLTRPEVRTRVLGRLSRYVIKPRTGHGGVGVFIAGHASAEERGRVAAAVKAEPHRFVAQETVRLSRHPTVAGGRLEPRHVDLRVFAVGSGRTTTVVPAPLTRVALKEGSLIVNSSQGGGAKDTWIVD